MQHRQRAVEAEISRTKRKLSDGKRNQPIGKQSKCVFHHGRQRVLPENSVHMLTTSVMWLRRSVRTPKSAACVSQLFPRLVNPSASSFVPQGDSAFRGRKRIAKPALRGPLTLRNTQHNEAHRPSAGTHAFSSRRYTSRSPVHCSARRSGCPSPPPPRLSALP